ncbi:MAG TPA: glycerate kinase [Lachnospiraceae bacterium]|nr:glycerate kinase [Lachnospiraceae bacterium]
MKVVIAIDSMKGCLSSLDCGKAVAEGLKRAIPDADYVVRPLADGGEGTVEAITSGLGGTFREIEVTGPLGKKIMARYGIIDNSDSENAQEDANAQETANIQETATNLTAIIEISSAAGLTLISDIDRDPIKTTTYGIGELISDAISMGCRNFIIGLGGSATNDAGIGMLQALGATFYDDRKKPLTGDNGYLTGGDLEFIHAISFENFNPHISGCKFRIACDVSNPLCGENGASYVFGPQKGLFDSEIQIMDKWIENFVATSREALNTEIDPDYPGCGAAGGLGFAFKYFLGGNLEAGNKIVIEETNLKKYLSDADIIVTGEGKLDEQTLMGKAPIGIAHIAKVFKKPVIAIVGSISAGFDGDKLPDVDAYFPVIRRSCTLEEAMDPHTARSNIAATTEQIFRLIKKIAP